MEISIHIWIPDVDVVISWAINWNWYTTLRKSTFFHFLVGWYLLTRPVKLSSYPQILYPGHKLEGSGHSAHWLASRQLLWKVHWWTRPKADDASAAWRNIHYWCCSWKTELSLHWSSEPCGHPGPRSYHHRALSSIIGWFTLASLTHLLMPSSEKLPLS